MRRSVLLLLVFYLFFIGCAAGKKARVLKYEEDQPTYDRLKKMGNKLLPVMDPERVKYYKIGIIEEDVINAFTTMPQRDKDGYPIFSIFFYRGLLNKLDDQEMLFIFAHEISHCRLNHVENRNAASQGISAVRLVGGFIVPGLGYLNYLVNPLITSAYSRSQEADADLLAAESIKKCCDISPDVVVKVLSLLDDVAKEKGYDEKNRIGIFDDHPGFQKRINNIEEYRNGKLKPLVPPLRQPPIPPTDFKRDKRYEKEY